jgi:hypothetical protein
MLLILDSSLIFGIDSDPNVINALDLIAHSRRSGKHIVFGKRDVIKFLASCDLISNTSRAVYRKLYEDLPTTFAYLSQVNLLVEIVLDDVLELIDRGNSKVIRASVKYFSELSILTETVLLSENHDDVIFYKRLAFAYLKWKNIGNIYIRYDPRSGGGHTTVRDFEMLQASKQRFCLCVLDSDKKAPTLDMGDTAKAVLRINDSNQPLCDVCVLSVREVENLIPAIIYREVFGSDANKINAIDFLEFIDSSQHSETRNYLDLKKGLKLYKVLKEEPQKQFRIYWLSIAQKFRGQLSSDCRACLDREACAQGSFEKCQCFITLGFGDTIMRKIEEKYLNNDLSSLISELVKPEWERLGSIITSWCCASPQMPTISSSQ